MHVEKMGENKIKIFISYDDLDERGIDRDEIWQSGGKVQELFWDMMEHAYLEVGFVVDGPIAVEAFTMPTEGVVVIVTQVPSLPVPVDNKTSEELQALPSPKEKSIATFTFKFSDFEDLITGAIMLHPLILDGVTLYHYENAYYLVFQDAAIVDDRYEDVWSLLQEYGSSSSVTSAVLAEYGKRIIEDHAIRILVERFQR